ncbi:odorant receptor 22c [Stomoxys calcitrans]|uniref:odorant receptor 22c n=1 Tax=Stomoxys calcitrans TaxID=35570 RepID=UPI0027E31573|nr:odorant receptor 22c [Stomoxys calcitrans]
MLDFLKTTTPITKSFMLIPRISGRMCGIWPQRHYTCIKSSLFVFSTFVVGIGAVGENLYGVVYLDDLVSALEAFCPGVTKVISLLKILVFFTYNRQWYDIVQRMRKMLMAENHCKEKMEIVERFASIGSIYSFILITSGMTTNIFFNIRPLAANLMRYLQNEPLQHVLPFNIIVPEIFVKYPLFPFTYAMLTSSGAMTVFTFSFCDGFFVCASMYMCGVFSMLQHDIRSIFAELSECETSTVAQNQRFRQQLSAIVERHNAIIDLCTDFTANFTLIVLLHFLSAALVLCSSLLDLMLNSASLGLLVYAFYSVAALTQLFLYCIGGSYVRESSISVADTLYDIKWYKCDVETRKMILMMLHRSQKATTIAVPFFTPSLSAFSSIISTTGSYIALLKTFL